MVYTPYPVDGVVYDVDGVNVVNNSTVVALNTTTGEKISMKTNSLGQFILDLANLTSGYSNGDALQVTATYGSGSAIRSLSKRHTVSTVAGAYAIGNMVLHPGEDHFGDCNLTFAFITSDTTTRYCDYYDRNDNLIFRISSIASSTAEMAFGYLGIRMDKGFIRVFSSETAGQCYSSAIYK